MSTRRTFQDMLNEYLTYDLLKEEMVKKSYILDKIEKDDGWKGGTLPVPFKAAGASSLRFGSLVASNNIAQDKFVRGSVASYKEIWGAMIFNQRDLVEQDGKVNEKSFLKLLPQVVEDFTERMRNNVSINILNGKHVGVLLADGDATGVVEIDRPDRLDIGQEVEFGGDTAPTIPGYVSAIDMNTLEVSFVTTRGGATPLNLTAYTTADNAKIYIPGAKASSFTSLRESLLSAANGGSPQLYGQTKTAYPYLQAINLNGSTVNATNLLGKVFDGFTATRQYGKGNPTTVLMSYKHLGSVMKAVELSKGAYKVTPNTKSAEIYGWTEIQITGVKGSLTVVGIQEIDDDVIMYIDWRALKFHSNGMFRKVKDPDNGSEYYKIRGEDGYQYILDMYLFGEFVLSRPSYCGIMHSISYADPDVFPDA